MTKTFLKQKGNYKDLIAFQKATCIYDVTYYFAHKFFYRGDRTIDQMVQAARSGKQNIAEGCSAGTTSSETEIKLINVAKASLQELLLDYEDYLRVNNLKQWPLNSKKNIEIRKMCYTNNDTSYYKEIILKSDSETIANIAITLIHQVDVLLRKLIDSLQDSFIKEGGIREQMSKARMDYKRKF